MNTIRVVPDTKGLYKKQTIIILLVVKPTGRLMHICLVLMNSQSRLIGSQHNNHLLLYLVSSCPMIWAVVSSSQKAFLALPASGRWVLVYLTKLDATKLNKMRLLLLKIYSLFT